MLTPEEETRKAKLLKEIKELEDHARHRYLSEAATQSYSFAKVKKQEDLAKIRRFQLIFGKHIPCLLESEHHTIHLHQRLSDGIFGNPPQTISKGTFEADLKRFRNAIKVLTKWPIWGAMVSSNVVPHVSAELRVNEDDVLHVAVEIYDFLLLIDDVAHHSRKLPQVLDQLERWAREASENLPDRRNINWEAVNAVDRLRGSWESYNEMQAPRRALNLASPFADYLREGFEFFEISGDAISAFKRWVAVEDIFQNIRIRKGK